MIIALLGVLCVVTVLYVMAGRRYDELTKPLDKKDFPLRSFLGPGLLILDAVKYRYASGYDRRLLTRTAAIYGASRSHHFLKIHIANKITYLLLGLMLVLFVGIGTKADAGYGVFSASVLTGIFYYTDRELDERIRKRRLSIQMDFPDFLNKLVLLINAGMTVSRAWEKVVNDSRKGGLLYEELRAVVSDIRSGKPEQRAYEDFAKRCRIPEITRFVSVVLQNLRKGNSELVSVLRVYAGECWEMRKNAARRLGEEASTRMLLPMVLMFLAVLLIVITPAVLALRGM